MINARTIPTQAIAEGVSWNQHDVRHRPFEGSYLYRDADRWLHRLDIRTGVLTVLTAEDLDTLAGNSWTHEAPGWQVLAEGLTPDDVLLVGMICRRSSVPFPEGTRTIHATKHVVCLLGKLRRAESEADRLRAEVERIAADTGFGL